MYQPSEQLVCPFFCIDLELATSITMNNKQAQTTTDATNTRFVVTTSSHFKLARFPKPYFINYSLVLNRIRAPGTGDALITTGVPASYFRLHQNASPVIT